MGEYRIHHVRFFDYIPKAVHCMAYNDEMRKLAVSRSDGSIDIWNVTEDWYQEQVIACSQSRSVEALLWCGSRLLSAGLHGFVHEHDLMAHTIKNSCSANSGAVWCMVLNDAGTHVAAGTEDGCVAIFDVTSDVVYYKSLSKQEGRILSVAWYSVEDLIITGGVDNIRVWSVKSGHAIQRLSLARHQANKQTIVWTIAVTRNFTIISGDSRGVTSFWDGRHGTLIKSFPQHKADVLALCVNAAGDSVFVAGVDPTMVQYQYVPVDLDSDVKKWVRSSVRSLHSHDVRALAYVGDVVVSAGVDCQIIVNSTELQTGGKRVASVRRLSPVPQACQVQTALEAHMLLLRYTDSVELWQLGDTTHPAAAQDAALLPLTRDATKLIELKVKQGEQMVSCAVSGTAQWLAYSDTTSLRLFHVTMDSPESICPGIQLTRVRCMPPGCQPAHFLSFSPDGSTLLSVANDNTVQLIRVDEVQPILLKTLLLPPGIQGRIHLLAVSASGKYLAVAELACGVHVYHLTKMKYICSLPHYGHQATALAFNPTAAELLVAYTDQTIVEYNIPHREYTEWSRSLSGCVYPRTMSRHKVRRLFYDPHNPQRIYVHSDVMLYVINKTQRMPTSTELSRAANHRKSINQLEVLHAFHFCHKFKYLMHVDMVEEDFLVIVERPPVSITETLPPRLKTKKFGV